MLFDFPRKNEEPPSFSTPSYGTTPPVFQPKRGAVHDIHCINPSILCYKETVQFSLGTRNE